MHELKLPFIQKLPHYALFYIYTQLFLNKLVEKTIKIQNVCLCILIGHTFSPSIILGNFKGLNFALLKNKLFVPACDVSN